MPESMIHAVLPVPSPAPPTRVIPQGMVWVVLPPPPGRALICTGGRLRTLSCSTMATRGSLRMASICEAGITAEKPGAACSRRKRTAKPRPRAISAAVLWTSTPGLNVTR
jgi:hypothetical protein